MLTDLFKKKKDNTVKEVEATAELQEGKSKEQEDLEALTAFENKIQGSIEKEPEIKPNIDKEILVEEQRRRDALSLRNPFRGT